MADNHPWPAPWQSRQKMAQASGRSEFVNPGARQSLLPYSQQLAQPYTGYIFRPIERPALPPAPLEPAVYPDHSYTSMTMPWPSSEDETYDDRRSDSEGTAAWQSSMASTAGGAEFAGRDDKYVATYGHYRPLVSQYALDESMMSGYENNNF
jgi:hypothetical protein